VLNLEDRGFFDGPLHEAGQLQLLVGLVLGGVTGPCRRHISPLAGWGKARKGVSPFEGFVKTERLPELAL